MRVFGSGSVWLLLMLASNDGLLTGLHRQDLGPVVVGHRMVLGVPCFHRLQSDASGGGTEIEEQVKGSNYSRFRLSAQGILSSLRLDL